MFSGIVVCDVCGARYVMSNRSHYRCSHFVNRGETVCANRVSVRKDVLEAKLLRAIKCDLFDDTSLDQFKAEAQRVLDERLKVRSKDAGKLRRDLANVELQIANMVGFIKAGTITPTLSDELRKSETEAKRLREALDTDLPQLEDMTGVLSDALDRFGGMTLNLEQFATKDVTRARNMIKALVGGEIRLIPTEAGGLNAELRGHYAGLIELVKESPASKARARKFGVVAGARY